jgi:hypothetical protein
MANQRRTCKLRLTHRRLPNLLARFQGGGGSDVPVRPSAGRFFFARVSASTLIFLGNDIRRDTLIVCDPEATPYKYLASIRRPPPQ